MASVWISTFTTYIQMAERTRKMGEQTGCTERRDRVSADNRTSLARRR